MPYRAPLGGMDGPVRADVLPFGRAQSPGRPSARNLARTRRLPAFALRSEITRAARNAFVDGTGVGCIQSPPVGRKANRANPAPGGGARFPAQVWNLPACPGAKIAKSPRWGTPCENRQSQAAIVTSSNRTRL